MPRPPHAATISSGVLAALLCAAAGAALPARADVEREPSMAWATLIVEPGSPTRLSVSGRTPADPAIAAALERIAGRPPATSEYAEGWILWTAELPAPARDRLVARQPLALEPLLAALDASGQPTLTMVVRHPRVGFVTLSGAEVLARQPYHLNAILSTRGSRPPSRLELGWRGADVACAIALLLLALAAPIAAGLAVRRRSLARDHAPQAWFGRAQTINVITVVGWVAWIAVSEAVRIADLTEFALTGPGGSLVMARPLWALGFLPAAFILVAITRDITRRLRGFDPLPRGHFQGQMRALVPLVLLLVALMAFVTGDARAGVFAVLGAVVAGVLLPGRRGLLGMAPQSLSSGALRERLFDLAHRAGVKLRELYVVPMRRERLANAFAVNGGMVLVADELLDRMSVREVDGVLAHEITHLEHHHPVKALLAAAGVWALVALVAIPLTIPYAFSAGFTLAWLTYLWVARRFELAADAGAAALVGDPEAVISGLGHLARLNDAPLTWGRGIGWLVTHPSTEARGLAVGRRAGLAPERVRELLADGLPPGERYGRAERPGEEGRVYSTAWKAGVTGRLSLVMLATAVLAPAATLALVRALGFDLPHPAAIAGGAALGLGAVLLALDRLAARPISRLEAAVRHERGGLPGAGAALFVGLSPGDRPRVYEGFLDWDLGLLSIEPDRLRYRGEQLAFELPRRAVRAIEIGAAMPNWIRAPRVIVRWQDAAGEEAVSLRLADARRVSAIGPASRALAARLRAWHGADGPAGDAPLETGAVASGGTPVGAAPRIGPVTSLTPAEAAAPRDVPLLVVLLAAFSAAAGFGLGLDLWRGLDVFAASLLSLLIVRWPAMTARERPAAAEPERERRAA